MVVVVGATVVVVVACALQTPGPTASSMMSPSCPSPECDWMKSVPSAVYATSKTMVSVPLTAVVSNFTPGPKPVWPPGTSPARKTSPFGEADTTCGRMSAEQNFTAMFDRPCPLLSWNS